MLKAGEYGIISRVSFSSSRGSVISMCRYREMIYGEGCEELELSRIGEIIGIAKAIDVVEADDSKLDISVESRVPPEKTIGKARKSLKIQVFLVVRSSFFARQIPLVFYSSLDWEMSEQEKSSRDPPKESCGTYSGSEWRLHISKRIRLLMALKLSSKAVRIMQRLRTMRAFLSACNFSYHSIFGGSYSFSKMRFWTPIK